MTTVPNENPAPANLFGADGLPLQYDWNWQKYTNLTGPQMAWFRAQPQWLAKYACIAHWHKEIYIIDNQLKMPYQDGSSQLTIPDASQTFPAIQAKIASVRQSMANIISAINAPGVNAPLGVSASVLANVPVIKTQDDIDAAIAALNV